MNTAGNDNMFVMLVVFGVTFLLLYFLVIRPRRRKERELEQLKNSLRVGDIITTIGGIVGIVVSVKDDGLTIETGSDKNKIIVKKWAIRDIEKLDGSFNDKGKETDGEKLKISKKVEEPKSKAENMATSKS